MSFSTQSTPTPAVLNPVYSATLLDLFRSSRHAGDPDRPTHEGCAGLPGAGPYTRVSLRAPAGVVDEARYRTYGCPAAIACSEAVCAWSEGRELNEARQVTAEQVAAWVGGVPEGKEHCPELAAQAMRSVRPVAPPGAGGSLNSCGEGR